MNTVCAFKRICRLFKDYVKRKKAKKNALSRNQNVLESMWYHEKAHNRMSYGDISHGITSQITQQEIYGDTTMSEIPYVFIPFPIEFMEHEFIEDPKMMRLLVFIMEQISVEEKIKKVRSNVWYEVKLQPFEFIFGRQICMRETGLTETEIRGRMERLTKKRLIKKIDKGFNKNVSIYSLNIENLSQNSINFVGE